MNILNISLTAIFIFVFKLGVFGAGFATLLSRIVAAIIMLVLICPKDTPLKLSRLYVIRLKWDVLKKIFNISISNAIENSVFQVGKILVMSIVAGLGLSSIVGNVVVGDLCTFKILTGSVIFLVAPKIIGQCLGANEKELAKYN